jgi:threonyl-tRNA synthetase
MASPSERLAAASVEITLPDGNRRTVPRGSTAGSVLTEWKPDLKPLAASLDGRPIDLSASLTRSGRLAPLRFEDRAGREIAQHSGAHLIAKAVTEVVPEARPTVGPPTDEGFYYDFDVRPLAEHDLKRIRDAIERTIRDRSRFERVEVPRDEALRLFSSNAHKQRYIREAEGEAVVSLYRTGTFVDLCRGPHVPDAGWLAGTHVLGISAVQPAGPGTPTLQRVRGVAFPTREALEGYLRRRAEAEARDHRVLGPRLELFQFAEEAPGFPFWLPKGMVVVRELERYVLEHLSRSGYSEVRTPLMFAQSVYETSGHWEHYRSDMFLTAIDTRVYGVKPMNCPGSMLIFGSRARSYRELPLRLAEFAPLHRLEASGTIHGLTRAREFAQDDAHLFVTEEQIDGELRTLLDWVREAFTTFRFSWTYELSTRGERFLGEPGDWDRAEAALERALRESGVEYRVSPGEGSFYAPKIDIHIRDSMGRPWQTGTIQLDYQMPRRFGLQYQGADGQLHSPVVIHRTILGSWERFLGVLIEHCAGRLPPWLAPVQVRALPVSDRQHPAAQNLVEDLRLAGIRAEVTGSQESLPKRVRDAEMERIPYVAVVGDREISEATVTLRVHGEKKPRTLPRVEAFEHLLGRIRSRSFEP